MPRITLVRSAFGSDGTALDTDTGLRVRVGETVEVSEDVAARLLSTRSVGDTWEVEGDEPTAPAQENDAPAPAPADAPPESAPPAQEV